MKSITLFPFSPSILPARRQQPISTVANTNPPQGDTFVSRQSKEKLHFGGKKDAEKLFQAIDQGNGERLTRLMSKKGAAAIVNTQDSNNGSTPLLKASAKGDVATMWLFIEKGADINQPDMHGNTPLIEAARNAHIDAVDYLVHLPQKINITHENKAGENAFKIAQAKGLTEIEAKLSQAAQEALFNEIKQGRKDKVEPLLASGASLRAFDAEGDTPLMKATKMGNIEVTNHLLNLGSKFAFQTALHLTEAPGKEKIRELFVKHIRENHSLEDLISRKSLDTLKAVVLPAEDLNGLLPSGKTLLTHAIAVGDPETVQCLLEKNANPNRVDSTGVPPLLSAARSGNPQIAKLLLVAGADPTAADQEGNTLLMQATLNHDLDLVKMALLRGAKSEQRNHKQQRALDFAKTEEAKEIKNELKRAREYNLFQAAIKGDQSMAEQLVLNQNDVNQTDENGETPLIYALRNGNSKVANVLLANGANPKIKGKAKKSFTSLHLGINKRLPVQTVKLLVEKGADIEAKTPSGFTPLMLAVQEKNEEIQRCLWKAGAQLSPVDDNGDDVFTHAERYKQDFILNLPTENPATLSNTDKSSPG